MVSIPIGTGDWKRDVAREAQIALKNRFFEQNPVLNPDGTSLVSRPRLKKWIEVGDGHIRKVFSEPGSFDGDLFVVSGTHLYRVDNAGTATDLGQISADTTGAVEMAIAANIGDTPARLFMVDGGVLWVYLENGQAIGQLSASGAPANNDVVEVGGVYYQYTTGSVDAGTPAGTLANPWLVARSGVTLTDLMSLYHAINATGETGEYSALLTAPHATVEAYSVGSADLYVVAREYGANGNTITSTETSANLSWAAATLQNGGIPRLRQVPLPNDEGAISVAHINQYIIVVPSQTAGVNGRFYWVEPGEVTIEALNFATAERAGDAINQAIVFSDMVWFCGQSTVEPWIGTGDQDAPFERFQGILYDRGSWEGTAIRINETLILADQNGGVFQIGGGLKRISNPAVEERIRKAIQTQEFLT